MEVGFTHGHLTVIGRSSPPVNKHRQPLWDVQCVCENIKPMRTDHIKRLYSCGCKRNELSAKSNTRHGHASDRSLTAEYATWISMKGRCYNKNNKKYPRYGGRGIKVCDEWLNNFEAFLNYMGLRPEQPLGKRVYSIERVDNDGNYEPGNVRWATLKEQANNTSTNRILYFQGVAHTIAEWSEITGVSRGAIGNRLKRGWSVQRTLTEK